MAGVKPTTSPNICCHSTLGGEWVENFPLSSQLRVLESVVSSRNGVRSTIPAENNTLACSGIKNTSSGKRIQQFRAKLEPQKICTVVKDIWWPRKVGFYIPLQKQEVRVPDPPKVSLCICYSKTSPEVKKTTINASRPYTAQGMS